ncbi:helix-turn-helix transcriptional regulator [Chitinophaga japonensis]|uniref:AraC-like DNA-binding protein n=1 Tax=Chitinophaga japonensis TaxID=104662 RepID=A0A562TF61_CHIJA|nr:helix-turn-helix transcriptional regulator [Chitinophaga japonensis]TWI92152.1 AraC-like DNA-binding protein [Chitinophaga japonensis]
MQYQLIKPGNRLQPYVQCYWLMDSEVPVELEDTIYPGGFMEMVFNLGNVIWRSTADNAFQTDPPIELVGQITRPMPIKGKGRNILLGIRFYPHTAACFLDEELHVFNDRVSNLGDVLGGPVKTLHQQLLDVPGLPERILLIENFLLKRLSANERKAGKAPLLAQIVQDMERNAFAAPIGMLAARYGITPRYLQKLFLQHIGVTPKLYSQIHRFQRSLRHMRKQEDSLTAIAYDCGYADQSHFIREFRSFAGTTPSAFSAASRPVNEDAAP